MACEIDLHALKQATNVILDHIVNDLGVARLKVEDDSDFYWEVPSKRLYAVNEDQPQLDVGRVCDDWEFLNAMSGESKDVVALMLIHLAPLLRYIGEKVRT